MTAPRERPASAGTYGSRPRGVSAAGVAGTTGRGCQTEGRRSVGGPDRALNDRALIQMFGVAPCAAHLPLDTGRAHSSRAPLAASRVWLDPVWLCRRWQTMSFLFTADGAGDAAVAPPMRPPARGNLLLGVLSPDDAALLAPFLARTTFAVSDVIIAGGRPLEHVYFPETLVGSVVATMADGGRVEVGTVGNEGMLGLTGFLDAEAVMPQAVCQIAGTALQCPAASLREAADARPTLRHLLNRYTHAYIGQVGQMAACNRMHGIEQRCARWLLMTHDRVGRAEQFGLTQEFLAVMLGVRRAGVTVAAGQLQQAGLIRYHRGGIRVLDRAGLEAVSCECYRLVRVQVERLLGGPVVGA